MAWAILVVNVLKNIHKFTQEVRTSGTSKIGDFLFKTRRSQVAKRGLRLQSALLTKGRVSAVFGRARVWVKALDQRGVRMVFSGRAKGNQPFWSPSLET